MFIKGPNPDVRPASARRRRTATRLTAVTLAAALLVACGSSSSGSSATTAAPTTAAPTSAAPTTDGSATTEAASTTSGKPACTGSESKVSIAWIGDLSGNPVLVANGKSALAGANLAVKEVNDAGGIACHQIELSVSDEAADPAVTATVIRAAIDKAPVAITGLTISSLLAGSVATVASAKIPWMGTSPIFKGVDTLPFFFSTQMANTVGGSIDVQALKQIMGGSLAGKKVAIEGNTPSATVDEIIGSITAGLAAEGVKDPMIIRDPIATTSWASQAANVVAGGVDAIITLASDGQTKLMGAALSTAGYKGVHLSHIFSNAAPTFAAINSPKFSALRDVNAATPGSEVEKALKDAGLSVDDANLAPGYFGREYAAMYTLAQALTKCGIPCSTDAFVAAVTSLGKVMVPHNVVPGGVDFTTSHNGINSATIWGGGDPTNPKAVGDPIVGK